ncbi:gliding motility lipoprotein GldH [Tenacibaculum sp.]|nr:gliding motility lipoprotein GldH [Tenacibaculum sp.]
MKIKVTKNRTFILFMCLAMLFVSCDSNRVYDSYHSVSVDGWGKEEPAVFEFPINDTLTKRNLFINVRNNNNYPFSNIFLITKMNFPDGQRIIDTLEYEMADVTGKFLGEGFTEVKENKLFYKENIIFPISGNYTINISQAMRKNGETDGVISLEGITDVGFRIEKIN